MTSPNHNGNASNPPPQDEVEAAADMTSPAQQAESTAATGEKPPSDAPQEPAPQDAEEAADAEAPAAEAEGPDPLQQLQAQLDERTDDLKRVNAEYANYRRRLERERAQLLTHARSSVIGEFLPILDDLDLAKKHGDLTGALKAINDKLQRVFETLDVRRFAAPGDEFDPAIHEAVQDISSGDDKAVGTVLRPGYFVGDRLARTAMVVIADREVTTSPEEAAQQAEQPATKEQTADQ